jgi:hypothetical protein
MAFDTPTRALRRRDLPPFRLPGSFFGATFFSAELALTTLGQLTIVPIEVRSGGLDPVDHHDAEAEAATWPHILRIRARIT